MNPDRLAEFEAIASRIVRPIFAGIRRRSVMHEEILAHLCEAFKEELVSLNDEPAAADAARRRLGDVDELRRQLQASVPFLERLFYAIFNHKEMVMSRWPWIMGMFASLVGLGFMFGLAIVFPAMAKLVQAVDLTQNRDHLLDAASALKISLMSLLALAIIVALSGIGMLGYAIKTNRSARTH
jgi:hypothetical protein